MSQNVEELQWRMNNNYDLPVHVYFERPQKDNKYVKHICIINIYFISEALKSQKKCLQEI